MEWEAIRENLGLIVFAAFWVLSLLVRAVRGKGGRGGPAGPMARRRIARRRAVIIALLLMGLAAGAWELSRSVGGDEELFLRAAAAVLAVLAFLAILFAGVNRSGRALQGRIDMTAPDERAAEISANEPLEPS